MSNSNRRTVLKNIAAGATMTTLAAGSVSAGKTITANVETEGRNEQPDRYDSFDIDVVTSAVDLHDVGAANTHSGKVRPNEQNKHGTYDVAVGDQLSVQTFYNPSKEDLRIEMGNTGTFVDDGDTVTFTVESGSGTVPVTVVAPSTNDQVVSYDIAVDSP